jgi:hypothetical protein
MERVVEKVVQVPVIQERIVRQFVDRPVIQERIVERVVHVPVERIVSIVWFYLQNLGARFSARMHAST